MKILLLGKNGQVGWELQRALQPLGEVISLDRTVHENTHYCGDVTNFEAINETINSIAPDIIINATAYTAVDKAESEQALNDLVNHLAIKNLAEQCKNINALLVHYSTDYVFGGTGEQAWLEDDKNSPINAYGQAKRDGEIALENIGVKFLNFRTSWVYASRGKNFIKTMLMLAKTKDSLSIINDQIGAPTSAALIADVTAQTIRYYLLTDDEQKTKLLGHYHLVATGETNWFDYAKYVFAIATREGEVLTVKDVIPTTTANYPTPAKRPLNSRLNNQKIQAKFKLVLPNWQSGVEMTVLELINKD